MNAPAFGSFGERRDDAERTEFFAWFHLVEVPDAGHVDETGAPVVVYRPSGSRFRDLVTCEVTSEPDARMRRVCVTILGSFIADPENSAFARDIAKSFIGAGVVYQSDADQLMEIVDDLRHRPPPGDTHAQIRRGDLDPDDLVEAVKAAIDQGAEISVTLGSGEREAPNDLPAVVSRGFAVYCGERPSFARDLELTRFSMENAGSRDERVLTMSFTRRG
jgi:hypothetical protein